MGLLMGGGGYDQNFRTQGRVSKRSFCNRWSGGVQDGRFGVYVLYGGSATEFVAER